MAKVKELQLDARKAPDWLVAAAARGIVYYRSQGVKIGGGQIFNIGKAITKDTDIAIGEGMSVVSQLAKPDPAWIKLVEKAAGVTRAKDVKLVLFPPEQMKLF